MANVNDLGLTNDDLGLDYEKIPEERAEFVAPLQPGTYLFQLPADLSGVWEVIERSGNKRIQAVLHGENALIAILPGNKQQDFSAWISNHAYPRGNGDNKIDVSDMQYLLLGLDPSVTPKTNPQFVAALESHAGKKFKASVVWSAYCNPNKPAFFEDAEGNVAEREDSAGCGENYYQKAIPRDQDGMYIVQFQCQTCQAAIRAFPKLRNFRSITADS